jgi:hypothetical protein
MIIRINFLRAGVLIPKLLISGEKMSLQLPQIKKILFTTDLSRQTRHAFSYAAELAHQYGATLTILYVMEDIPVPQSANLQAFIGRDRWRELQQSNAVGSILTHWLTKRGLRSYPEKPVRC